MPLLVALATTPAKWCGRTWSKPWGSSAPRAGTNRTGRRQPEPGVVGVGQGVVLAGRGPAPAPCPDPIDLAVSTLQAALADKSAAVRTQAARGTGPHWTGRRGSGSRG